MPKELNCYYLWKLNTINTLFNLVIAAMDLLEMQSTCVKL